MKEEKKPFKIPDATLRQLNEFSNGGYILFKMSESGHPEVYLDADNPIISMGLIEFVRVWSSSVQQTNEMNMMDNMMGMDDDEDDEDFSE